MLASPLTPPELALALQAASLPPRLSPQGRRWRRLLAAAPRAKPRAALSLGCGSALSHSPPSSLSLLPATHFLGRVIVRGNGSQRKDPFQPVLTCPAGSLR